MYTQITAAERYPLARLRQHHVPLATIARLLGRHRSTLYRAICRNAAHADGAYRAELADARTRRSRSRRHQRFTPKSALTRYIGSLPSKKLLDIRNALSIAVDVE